MIDVHCGNCGEVAGQSEVNKNWSGKCPHCNANVEYVANLNPNRMAAYSEGVDADDPALAPATPPPDGTRVMCPSCGRNLLGIWKGGALHIRHKGREWLSVGVIGVKCHDQCGEVLSVNTRTYNVTIVSSLREVAKAFEPEPEATDAAIKLARDSGVDLRDVVGTGADGKVIKPDVEALLQ
jgi:pyruvate/2-oxoglutarate dehydrogenase complex dihydrolipoamide acyltransferase (E2) component